MTLTLNAILDSQEVQLKSISGLKKGNVDDCLVFEQCGNISAVVGIYPYFLCPQEIISKNQHILGDSAFPLLENLTVPYKATHILTEKEKSFNRRLSSTRVVIEQAFGLLLGRFRRLDILEAKSIELMSLTVTSACILHNLALQNNDFIEIDNDHNTDLTEFTEENNQDCSVSLAINQRNGVDKRNNLADR
eukprot:XP_016658762.1 PREDICTED: uncharacterized protein LOC107883385 [Acyrthosiphon pisum]